MVWYKPVLFELLHRRGANAGLAIVEIEIDFLLFHDKFRFSHHLYEQHEFSTIQRKTFC